MSFSDVMAALVVIFILASLVLLMQLVDLRQDVNKEIKELKIAEKVRKTVVEDIARELKDKSIEVQIAENHSIIRIPNDVLGFRSGKFSIDSQYQDTARIIGEVLASVVTKDNRTEYLDTIFVEGHTDNRPFWGAPGKGNWGLSTFRAISLWEYWGEAIDKRMALYNLRNHEGQPLFSVSGYADTRPVTEIQSAESDYELNRRIDIRITIRRPDAEDYEKVKSKFGEPDATPQD
ncbi:MULTISPECIES: OmpA family protein [unclassified Alcanivorax]|uniref:OmpA/MotB family protein n=1 Tax=unclassified Alcanivorax TaxID=2638842 RepID=UPI001E56EB0F|nr:MULTISPECIES: OmpA family protein [unclassified Alcanivorax]